MSRGESVHLNRWGGLTFEQRFWAKVEKGEGCWLWTGALDRKGYGDFAVETSPTKLARAHRVSWAFANGPIPSGIHVLHRCDVPRCVRPDHLFLGTQRDNMRDMVAKGRHGARPGWDDRRPHGSGHYNAKLTEAQVIEIRQRHAAGETYDQLAAAFGLHFVGIGRIVRRERWTHVP